jgi:cell wall-associated NlpC family hydrolase
VVWGYGSHIGIYIGNGKAISTLRNGVRIHGVFAVTARFTAYLHTGLSTKPAS